MRYIMGRLLFGFMYFGVLLTATGAITSADEANDEAIRKDHKLIEGTWRIVALEINGEKSDEEDSRKLTVVNGSDGTWSVRSEGNEISKEGSTGQSHVANAFGPIIAM